MMEHSTPTISLICRNARLSLQKAVLSRRSHMLSEELEHLRDFESLVSETLPLHPHFSFKREQKELLELDSHLQDVRKRLTEIECKHPFLYKHHHKGRSSFHVSNSKSKRPKEGHENYKPHKKKTWSSLMPHTTTRPPSSSSSASSSACKKGLPASFLSEYGRRSPPTPSKRSLSTSCSRSPSLRSNSSGSLGIKNLKRSFALRSPLNSVVDDASLPSEKLKLSSHSTAFSDAYHDDLRFPSHKHLLSPDNLKHRPKYTGDVRSLDLCEEKPASFTWFPRMDLELASSADESHVNSSLGVHVNEASFSSHKSKLPSSKDRAKCRSLLQSYVDEIAIPSPKAHPSWHAHSSDTEDDTGKALMECDASKLQAKCFVDTENHAEHLDGEVVEEVVDCKPSFTSQLASRSVDALSSSFSSSASRAVATSLHCSLGRLSPPWDSSRNTSSNLVSNELESQSYQHQKGSSNWQQLTFCNPVFDFDSSKGCAESILRSRLDPCDANRDAASPSEERLKSILGECAYVASHLNSYGEAGLNDESNGFLADAHTNSRVPSPIAEPKVRGKGLPREDVSGGSCDERDTVLQVSELTKRMDSFQRMLHELKEMVQSSSLHVQEQVDICEANVKGMERQLNDVKLETNSEMLGLKRLVKAQLDTKVQKRGSKRDCDGDGSFEEKMQGNMDGSSSKLYALQKRVDAWMSKIQMELRSQVEDAVASSMEKFGSSIRTDMEKLELQRLRDLGNLKKEMGLKLSLHESKEQLNKISEKQLDLIVEDVLGKQFSHLVEMFSAEKENEFAQIKSELAYLRKEYEAHFRGRAGVQEHAETMTLVKKQLHSIRNDGLQVKFQVDGMKKETDAHVHDIRLSIDKLKIEALDCRERILGLERLLSEKQQSDPKKNVEKLYKVRTGRSTT